MYVCRVEGMMPKLLGKAFKVDGVETTPVLMRHSCVWQGVLTPSTVLQGQITRSLDVMHVLQGQIAPSLDVMHVQKAITHRACYDLACPAPSMCNSMSLPEGILLCFGQPEPMPCQVLRARSTRWQCMPGSKQFEIRLLCKLQKHVHAQT